MTATITTAALAASVAVTNVPNTDADGLLVPGLVAGVVAVVALAAAIVTGLLARRAARGAK